MRLFDLLRRLGLHLDALDDASSLRFEGLHLHLLSSQALFGASLPLSSLRPQHLVATHANDEALPRVHGGALRAVLPGVVGARWIKWRRALHVDVVPEASAPMQADYKMLCPPAGLAGLEMGGIAVVTALGRHAKLPCAFVRKQAKQYGTARLSEGAEVAGRRVLVVEDVVTSGGQVVISTGELRKLGAHVDHAHPPGGQRRRLVEDEALRARQPLERPPAADQDPVARGVRLGARPPRRCQPD